MNPFKPKRMRQIVFPQEYSLGRLYLSSSTGNSFFALAQGTVSVPEGSSLVLHVTADAGDLSPLGKLGPRDLQGLCLSGTSRTDAALCYISALTGLAALHFDYTRLTGKGFQWLSELRALYLSARYSRIADEGVKFLQAIPTLDAIDLSSSRISDRAVQFLAQLPKLESLCLSHTKITDAGVSALAAKTNIRRLTLSGTRITDRAAGTFAQMAALEELDLSDTSLTDQALIALSELTALRTVNLKGTMVTPAGVSSLGNKLPQASISLGTQWRMPIPAQLEGKPLLTQERSGGRSGSSSQTYGCCETARS